MTTARKTTTRKAAPRKAAEKATVVKNEVPDEVIEDSFEVLDPAGDDGAPDDDTDGVTSRVETVEVEVTLANGVTVTLDVIRDQNDWDYFAVEAMQEMNYPVLVNAILTRGSHMKLKMSGAKVRDFEMITQSVSKALNLIRDEREIEKKK